MSLRDFVSKIQRIAGRLTREGRVLLEQMRICFVSSYLPAAQMEVDLARRFACFEGDGFAYWLALGADHQNLIHAQAEEVLAHRFDLLGSGPVVVAHGLACAGLEGYRFAAGPAVRPDSQGHWLDGRINRCNLAEAKRIWSLVDSGYQAIDWQLDFKSGYRWSERCWYRRIRFGHQPGVDVKLPWELARMQHLPVLALSALYAKGGANDFGSVERYGREVRNQILDFIATNPPGFGVNWFCAMDVGIRLANMLVAKDLLRAAGQSFDPEAEAVFVASVRSHGRHVAANLEWAPRFRGNHYLANIVGLLFAAVYLPRDGETDMWLSFATEELLTEVRYQFHEDGSNFEASVCYHRLSAEIVLWGLALLENLPADKQAALSQPCRWVGGLPPARQVGPVPLHCAPGMHQLSPVPDWCRVRVEKMAAFTRAVTRPDGLVVQFGDNDSGRFITAGSPEQILAGGDPAHPAWSLNHRALLSGVAAFLGDPPTDANSALLAALIGRYPGDWDRGRPINPQGESSLIGGEAAWAELMTLWAQTPPSSRWRCEFYGAGLLDGLECFSFTGMGCYILRSSHLHLAVRCGELGLAGLGAHAHCDQLAIDLTIDGIPLIKDPGSYIYTALPVRRNAYRSVMVHHAPRCGEREPGNLNMGVFDLRDAAQGECLYFGFRGFAGRHIGYGSWVYRLLVLEEDRVVVLDFSPGGLPVGDPTPRPVQFSTGYGRLSALH